MPQQWQPVSIPFAAGIKPTSRGRNLDQAKLLTAQNCVFVTDEGPEKRAGHVVRSVKTQDPPIGLDGIVPPAAPPLREPFSLDNPGLSDYWLHGVGLIDGSEEIEAGTFGKSAQPSVGVLHGQWLRDSEVVFWDGFRALSAPGNQTTPFGEVTGEAVMPALRGAPIAKSLNGQQAPDAVDNGTIRSVAWIYAGDAYRSVYDSETGATLVNEEQIALNNGTSLRLLTLGPWTHLVAHDTGTDELIMRSWHEATPQTMVSRSLGETSQPVFDVKKIDEETGVVARILGAAVEITVVRQTGVPLAIYTPDLDGEDAIGVAVTANAFNRLGVLWQNSTFEPFFCAYELDTGVLASSKFTVGAACNAQSRMTVADNYSISAGEYSWTAYVEDKHASLDHRLVRVYSIDDAATLQTTRYNTQLASHAFRVGQRTYVWTTGTPTLFTLQPTWFLCDEKLLPIGKALFALAYVPDTSTFVLPSVTWHTTEDDHSAKDRFVFFGCLGYRQRAETSEDTQDPNGVWLEPSVFFYTLDFLPYIRSAQAGRSTYIAGAQLWEYDGANLNEAGFHMAPESYTFSDGGAGNLDEGATYNWRIDLCYKNAQNEEVRSWSTTLSYFGGVLESPTTMKATITIPHVPMTRRDNSYFLVYRTEADGTEYYLVSSRNPDDVGDPNGFVFNDRSAATYTFTDNLADASLIDNEYHPSNATGWLQPFSAPACEMVAAGRDRLWVAGGELSPGEIAPSRYFSPGQTPAFTPALNIQIDRNSEPITAVGFVGEVGVFFRKTSAYTLQSEGPDNVGQGVWDYPRLALADVGAVSQEALALAGEGLYFQSPAGIRVITAGGGLRPPGAGLVGGLGTDVDTLAAEGDYAAAVVVPKYSQIRWYSRDPEKPSLVVDYTKNIWTTFTGVTCRGAAYWAAGSSVILARGDGEMWTETEGRYLDGDRTYEMVIKTAWLHAAGLGEYERARRFALFGEASDGLSLRYRVYYDERPFHTQEETLTFIGTNPTTPFNPSGWGEVNWGYGPWGDESAEANAGSGSALWFRDGMFRFRRRFSRQKCSVFAIEFSDLGSNAAFTPVVLGLELGLKQGLDRIP